MAGRNRPNPEVCPVCGEDVPRNAKACRGCGACHESGWNEISNIYDGLDLPDYSYEDEDEDEKIARPKFRQRKAPERKGLHPGWRIVALVLVIAFFAGFWKWLYAQFVNWGAK
ncbi:MAG: hypothetical protein RL088_1566 [Verrucomicrobiota bacterium]|jgi:hypothetical protein